MEVPVSMPSLAAWQNFYVVVGSSAAALIGLMFVAIAFIANFRANSEQNPLPQIQAFGTPTVVHISAALLESAIMTAPWPTFSGLRLALAGVGSAGVIYVTVVTHRAHRQTGYEAVFEDWLCHSLLPFAAYGSVVAAAWFLPRSPMVVLFVIGGAAALLLFVGIHNAWDTVTYILYMRWKERTKTPS